MGNKLGFNPLTAALASVFDAEPDTRQAGKTRYALSDAGLAAFSVFFTQAPSFLAHQRDMEARKGNSNATTLFGMTDIPTDTHIRNLLDGVPSERLNVLFRHAFQELRAAGQLNRFKTKDGTLLLAMDGTEYFTSSKIHCQNCTSHEKNGTVRYSHTVIPPVVVHPDHHEVISLEPIFITPQDGEKKQDSELKAAKRWVRESASHYALEDAVVLTDDLLSHQPFCELLLEHDLNFVLVCKPDSHKTLYEYLDLHPASDVQQRVWNGRHGEIRTYRYATGVPLRDGDDALNVNWCSLTTLHEETGAPLFHNSFITNLPLTSESVVEIVAWGRTRWKTENENNNVLKTKGYAAEHNYGHGEQHLSSTLFTLLLYAFLLHTILTLTHGPYQQVRAALGRRDTFFHDVRALTRYHLFPSWDQLLNFMMVGLELSPIPPDTS